MALICLIGGAVRAAGAMELLMPLVAMGAYCPSLGLALRMWVAVEERHAGGLSDQGPVCDEDGDDVRPGWVDREGPVLLWRHVTRFGRAVVIPVRESRGGRRAGFAEWAPVRWLGGEFSAFSVLKIFAPDLGWWRTAV